MVPSQLRFAAIFLSAIVVTADANLKAVASWLRTVTVAYGNGPVTSYKSAFTIQGLCKSSSFTRVDAKRPHICASISCEITIVVTFEIDAVSEFVRNDNKYVRRPRGIIGTITRIGVRDCRPCCQRSSIRTARPTIKRYAVICWPAVVGTATHAAVVKDVALAVASAVSDAFTATHAALVKDVAFAVASAISDAFTAAHAALVEDVAFAVASAISDAFTATHATLVKDVALAVASAVSDAFTAPHAALVTDVAFAVASAVSDPFTAAHAALVKDVALAVTSAISDAFTAAHAALVKDVALAVAFAVRDVFARAIVVRGFVVVVASHCVNATRRTTSVEFKDVAPLVRLIGVHEDLELSLTGERTVGCDLGHQNLQIWTREGHVRPCSIGTGEGHKPSRTGLVIHSHV